MIFPNVNLSFIANNFIRIPLSLRLFFFSFSEEKNSLEHKESGIKKSICKRRDGSSWKNGDEHEYEHEHANGARRYEAKI